MTDKTAAQLAEENNVSDLIATIKARAYADGYKKGFDDGRDFRNNAQEFSIAADAEIGVNLRIATKQ